MIRYGRARPMAGEALVLALALATLAGCGAAAPADAERPMVVVPAGDARFDPLVASLPDGPQIAVLWGDPATGPSAMLLRTAMGSGPLHYHSSDYHLVLLEGQMKHWAQGETEADARVLGPGSYWFQPGGQVHGDACLTAECVMFVTWADRRDAALADESDDAGTRAR